MITVREKEIFTRNCNGLLYFENLHEIKRENNKIYYKCPCGGVDHYATRVFVANAVLHCYFTNRFWVVEDEILGIVEREEIKFNKLLDKWLLKLPNTLTAEQAVQLQTAQGVPYDVVESLADNHNEFLRLMAVHKEKSKNTKLSGAIFV